MSLDPLRAAITHVCYAAFDLQYVAVVIEPKDQRILFCHLFDCSVLICDEVYVIHNYIVAVICLFVKMCSCIVPGVVAVTVEYVATLFMRADVLRFDCKEQGTLPQC